MYAAIYAAPPGTAVFHAVEKGWNTTDYLLAELIDGIAVGNWQRTEGAQSRPPKGFPDPYPRPTKPKTDDAAAAQQQQTTSSGKRVVDLGIIGQATPTTVADFMKRRAEREARWREKHGRRKRTREGA